MTTHQHTRWNIRFDDYTPDQFIARDADQARALAEHFTALAQRLAEAEFLLSCHDPDIGMPEELAQDWPSDDYREIEAI